MNVCLWVLCAKSSSPAENSICSPREKMSLCCVKRQTLQHILVSRTVECQRFPKHQNCLGITYDFCFHAGMWTAFFLNGPHPSPVSSLNRLFAHYTTSPRFLLCRRDYHQSQRKVAPEQKKRVNVCVVTSCFHIWPMWLFFQWAWAEKNVQIHYTVSQAQFYICLHAHVS